MNCPYCKAELPEGTKFCTSCGKYIAEETVETPAPESIDFEKEQPIESTPEKAAEASIPVQPVVTPSEAKKEETPLKPVIVSAPSDKTIQPGKGSPWECISTAGWVGIKILLSIPIVNLILVLVWSFGGCRKNVKKNYSRATLILVLVNLLICIVCTILVLTHIPELASLLGQLSLLIGKVTFH